MSEGRAARFGAALSESDIKHPECVTLAYNRVGELVDHAIF